MKSSLIKYVKKNQYIDMPDLLTQIISDNQEIAVFPIHEYWLDIGQIDDFERGEKEYSSFFKNEI